MCKLIFNVSRKPYITLCIVLWSLVKLIEVIQYIKVILLTEKEILFLMLLFHVNVLIFPCMYLLQVGLLYVHHLQKETLFFSHML